jgi:hypothetical protein
MHLFAAFPMDGVNLAHLGSIAAQRDWQEGFFDHLLRSHESYSQKWEICAHEPGTRKALRHLRVLAIQGEIVRNPFD